MQESRVRAARAAAASVAFHGAVLVLLLALLTSPQLGTLNTEAVSASLTYVHVSGKGGGGGGGNRPHMPATQPAPAPSVPETAIPAAPTSMPVTLLATPSPLDLPGTITGLSAPIALAPAGPGGGGSQPGGGAGDGKGDGVGPGSDRNTGGDEYQVGDNVTVPVLVYEKKPTYTPAAVLAKIQGIVELEVIVMADGSVARPRVVHSLDRGLDERAIEAVTQWRFRPGRRRDTNQPVNVRVRVHLTFMLR
jgi:protein TonB